MKQKGIMKSKSKGGDEASPRAEKKQIIVQRKASTLALMLSILLLLGVFVFSTRSIASLEAELMPLIDGALEAARKDELGRVWQTAIEIDGILRAYEPALMLCASHRDIMELLGCSGVLAALGSNGERDDYIEALADLRVLLHLLKENNSISIGNIL